MLQRFDFPNRVTAIGAAFVTGAIVGAAAAGGLVAAPTPASPVTATASAVVPPATAADLAQTRYPVEVTRIVDGDTFEARVRAWPGIDITTKVRLRNIDAPEIRARCDRELAQARAARDALAAMLGGGRVSIGRVSLDKYGGRVLADASAGSIPDVASALLEAGLVRPYSGGRRESWCISSQSP